MEDQGHADQDRGQRRRGGGEQHGQNPRRAERAGQIAEKIDAEAGQRADQDDAADAAAALRFSEKLAAISTIAANSSGTASRV